MSSGANALFNALDVNADGVIDRNEFSQLLGGVTYATDASSGYDVTNLYSSGAYGAGYGGSASYDSSASYGAGSSAAYGASAAQVYDASSFASSGGGVQVYATDAQGLFQDPNPQVIRRPAASGVQTYTQNIAVRFLQPPPVPPHGPLIIREVRPPQPPAPAPLRLRQVAPPLPTPPPLVLRERPPQPPGVIPSQTVIRRLAGLPVPPRSVIIERIPPLPPRPRDIILERWVPYGAQAKRRTIVQRAPPAKQYAAPRNVIIQYEPSQARIVRQFQRFGVVQGNPGAYVQQYGAQLLDAAALVQQARAAGVVEDITPPAASYAVGFSGATYGQDLGVFAGDAALGGGAVSYTYSSGDAGLGAESSYSSYESSSYGGDAGGYSYGSYNLGGYGVGDGFESYEYSSY
jgi:hypothetical protein